MQHRAAQVQAIHPMAIKVDGKGPECDVVRHLHRVRSAHAYAAAVGSRRARRVDVMLGRSDSRSIRGGPVRVGPIHDGRTRTGPTRVVDAASSPVHNWGAGARPRPMQDRSDPVVSSRDWGQNGGLGQAGTVLLGILR